MNIMDPAYICIPYQHLHDVPIEGTNCFFSPCLNIGRGYYPEVFREIVAYFPEDIWEIVAYFPEEVRGVRMKGDLTLGSGLQ